MWCFYVWFLLLLLLLCCWWSLQVKLKLLWTLWSLEFYVFDLKYILKAESTNVWNKNRITIIIAHIYEVYKSWSFITCTLPTLTKLFCLDILGMSTGFKMVDGLSWQRSLWILNKWTQANACSAAFVTKNMFKLEVVVHQLVHIMVLFIYFKMTSSGICILMCEHR